MKFEERERLYRRDAYYWGRERNDLAAETLRHVPGNHDGLKLVDIGAGEGRDAVYFAEQGFDVFASDISPAGLEKAERLAEERGVSIRTVEADANHLFVPWQVDVFYSIGALQYIEPGNREDQFDHFKSQTAEGGVHAMFAFVDHEGVPTPPDWTDEEHFYQPGELADYYDDWRVLDEEAFVFDDDSMGVPHQHAAETLIVQKPQ
ncbi:SAM-dependent methyltransferase [Haloarchaeobius sp. TZWWS8]|uniref:SAM-dependent methyltransferase n=1 Tax=Haloarchaeobius sp. TZWWS8 TaxID=3446121 RepID=UPI003EBE3B0E